MSLLTFLVRNQQRHPRVHTAEIRHVKRGVCFLTPGSGVIVHMQKLFVFQYRQTGLRFNAKLQNILPVFSVFFFFYSSSMYTLSMTKPPFCPETLLAVEYKPDRRTEFIQTNTKSSSTTCFPYLPLMFFSSVFFFLYVLLILYLYF